MEHLHSGGYSALTVKHMLVIYNLRQGLNSMFLHVKIFNQNADVFNFLYLNILQRLDFFFYSKVYGKNDLSENTIFDIGCMK